MPSSLPPPRPKAATITKMSPERQAQVRDVDVSHAVLIVVGAHLRAEMADRPLAYALGKQMRQWVTQHETSLRGAIEPIVCSDIWYVNQQMLQSRPTISLGGPGVNALTAYFVQKLDPNVIGNEQMIIQLDPEFVDLRVCIWGMNHAWTEKAVGLFIEHYLDRYLRAVATQVEPDGV